MRAACVVRYLASMASSVLSVRAKSAGDPWTTMASTARSRRRSRGGLRSSVSGSYHWTPILLPNAPRRAVADTLPSGVSSISAPIER